MPRGRPKKLLSLETLQNEAILWCSFLYQLRDGLPERISKNLEYLETAYLQELKEEDMGRPDHPRRPLRPYRTIATIVVSPGEEEQVARVLSQLKKKGRSWGLSWTFHLPVRPRPELWNQLKKARSVADIQRVARKLDWEGKLFRSRARDLLKSKKLPTYPKSNRNRSDDKRVKFLAKVLAGLSLGLKPTTAIKSLSCFNLPDASPLARDYEAVGYYVRIGRNIRELFKIATEKEKPT